MAKFTCSSGEYQNSRVLMSGWLLPTTPGLSEIVSREPTTSRPSIASSPMLSRLMEPLPLGNGPAGRSLNVMGA